MSDEQSGKFPTDYFYPRSSTVCTQSFSEFLTEYHAHIDYFFFVVRIVSQIDENRVRAAAALLPSAKSDAEKVKYEKSIEDNNLVLRQLTKHSTVQSQNLTNGLVSAFQRYFSGIIQSAALKNPATLSSAQTVKLEEIFKFSTYRGLISFIIDKKVNELAYSGLYEMEKYFADRLGMQMFQSDLERIKLRLFIESRNINVHNGGIVNDIFESRVGKVDGYKYTKGKRFHVDFDSLVALSENAMRVAMAIDEVVAAKFRLRRKSHAAWTGRSTKKK